MSPWSGKVKALFPPHTTIMMSFSLSLFFFLWLHELSSWCVLSRYWWASMLMCRQKAREKECTPVCSICSLFDCQSWTVCSSVTLSLVGFHLTSAAKSLHGQYNLLMIAHVSGRKKQNPVLFTLLLFPTIPITLELCGHGQRCSGG